MALRRSNNLGEMDRLLDEICEEEQRREANAAAEAARLEIEAATKDTYLEAFEEEEGKKAERAQGSLARQLFSDEDHENDADKPEAEDIDGEDMEEEALIEEEETLKEGDVIEDGAEEAKPLSPEAARDEMPPKAAKTRAKSGGVIAGKNSSGRGRAAVKKPRPKSKNAGGRSKAPLKRPAAKARLFIFDRFRDMS